MSTAYDSWKTSPPEELEPQDHHYLAAEDEIQNDDWFAEEVEALAKDGLSFEDAKKRVLRSDAYQQKITDLAFQNMESEIESFEAGDEGE
jgi:hypothetical protein